MSEQNAEYVRPEGCVCMMFRDTGGFRIADLACRVHGVSGSDPGDGYWERHHLSECLQVAHPEEARRDPDQYPCTCDDYSPDL